MTRRSVSVRVEGAMWVRSELWNPGRRCDTWWQEIRVVVPVIALLLLPARARPSYSNRLSAEITARLPVHQTCRYALTPSPQDFHLSPSLGKVGISILPSTASTLCAGSKSTEARTDQDSLHICKSPHPMTDADPTRVVHHPCKSTGGSLTRLGFFWS